MSIVSTIKKRYARMTPKQLMLSGVFMLGLAAAIGGGFASKQYSSAATGRDCSSNSIDKADVGDGCGAYSPSEFCTDLKTNKPSDLRGIYKHFSMAIGECERFKETARMGTAYQDGKVVVDGQTVITNAWSIGRSAFSYSKPYPISGVGTYRKSMHTDVLKSNLPVMVMFDENGTPEFAVLKACGNPVNGNKVRSGATCKSLNATPVTGKKNTYRFTTSVSTFGFAKVTKVQYFMDEGSGAKLFATTSNPGTIVEKTFNKSATVTVKVTISLPGKQSKVITGTLCAKKIGVVKEEFLYVCEALVATARDNTNRKFRFTVFTKQSNNVTVDSADFTLDGSMTVKGVTSRDANGRLFKDYDFTDTTEHKVSVIVNFTADGKKVTSKVGDCVAKVTPKKPPVCIHNPELPPNHPGCKPPKTPECKPGVPVGSKDCDELPKTGAGGAAGLFAGVSLAGAIGHRLFLSRRNRA